jgi:hypothetical protein
MLNRWGVRFSTRSNVRLIRGGNKSCVIVVDVHLKKPKKTRKTSETTKLLLPRGDLLNEVYAVKLPCQLGMPAFPRYLWIENGRVRGSTIDCLKCRCWAKLKDEDYIENILENSRTRSSRRTITHTASRISCGYLYSKFSVSGRCRTIVQPRD